jgi:hypothetical protein
MLERMVVPIAVWASTVMVVMPPAANAARIEAIGSVELPGTGVFTNVIELTEPASGSSTLADAVLHMQGNAAAQVVYSARVGALGILAGSESAGFSTIQGRTSLRVSWSDMVTINPGNPALLGTPGSFSFLAGLSGSGGAIPAGPFTRGEGSASYRVQLSLNREPEFISSGRWHYVDFFGSTFTGDAPNQSYSGAIPFLFGVPFGIAASLQADSFATSIEGKVESFVSMIGTLKWNGITEVRDLNGTPLTDLSVTSDSGVDWLQAVAVPEPGTVVLLLTALPVVALAVRRHRRRSGLTNRVSLARRGQM